MSAPGSNASPLQNIFKTIGADLVADVKGAGFALLTTFFSNVKANPSPQNVAAQGAILAASAILQLPNLEQEGITQLADIGQSSLSTLSPTTLIPTAS